MRHYGMPHSQHCNNDADNVMDATMNSLTDYSNVKIYDIWEKDVTTRRDI